MFDDRAVAREVADAHDFIQAWIRGEVADTEADFTPFSARFSDDFALIGPTGSRTAPGGGVGLVRGLHGTNPAFRIWTRDAQILRQTSALVLATYTEWQDGAIHTAQGFNGRWSTVGFDVVDGGLRWAWLHETWLPPELVEAARTERGNR